MFADRDVKREYNVQHAVGGSEQMPLNLWSIVFLTKAPDHATASRSSKWSAQDLSGFIEIYYIERDLKLKVIASDRFLDCGTILGVPMLSAGRMKTRLSTIPEWRAGFHAGYR